MSTLPDWLQALQPASWRGQTFYVSGGSFNASRNVVVKVFPYRDLPYVEDVGRAPTEIRLNGYLVSGTDGIVWDQRASLIDTCQDTVGPGELIHPSRGSLNCVMVECRMAEERELGGVVAIEMTFVVTEASVTASPDDTSTALATAATSSDGSFTSSLKSIGATVKSVQGGIAEVQGYVGQVRSVVNSATRSLSAISGLGGALNVNIGRYLNGPLSAINKGFGTVTGALSGAQRLSSGVTSALNGVAAARTGAILAATKLESFVSKL